MSEIEIKKIIFEDEQEFNDRINFKLRSETKKAFYKAVGRKGAHYLRQAVEQITSQFSDQDNQEPKAK